MVLWPENLLVVQYCNDHAINKRSGALTGQDALANALRQLHVALRVHKCSMAVMFSRPLSSFPISEACLSVLSRAGFRTIDDLETLTPEQLSEGRYLVHS